MNESWEDEDWENLDLSTLIIPNLQELKKIEERKLVEEADNELSKDLFSNAIPKQIDINNFNTHVSHSSHSSSIELNKTNALKRVNPLVSKKKENEDKQKELSQKITKQKEEKKRHIELFGEFVDNEYSIYEDKFYN
jgi:hypothetical protein